jgi:hypothetical protein
MEVFIEGILASWMLDRFPRRGGNLVCSLLYTTALQFAIALFYNLNIHMNIQANGALSCIVTS